MSRNVYPILKTPRKVPRQLATFLNGEEMTLNQHKLFADALSQYIKLKMTIPTNEQQETPYDMRTFLAKCNDEELAIIQPVIKAVAARDVENEEKIKPIRRIG